MSSKFIIFGAWPYTSSKRDMRMIKNLLFYDKYTYVLCRLSTFIFYTFFKCTKAKFLLSLYRHCTVLHRFTRVLFLAGNRNNNKILVPFMQPHHLSLIFIGMKQKINKIAIFSFKLVNSYIF